ncbi:MAG: hypothetical protein EAZ53_17145 [Bacteroidetes bacterium]|nr:MAG: hypothetical protein EAZ53_17145 [Bacteroidota bacterium]
MNGYQLMKFFYAEMEQSEDMVLHCGAYHISIFTWLVELQNRVGWEFKRLDLPTDRAMMMSGIGSYKTYIRCVKELMQWGLITELKPAKNQHSARKITLYTPKWLAFLKQSTSKKEEEEVEEENNAAFEAFEKFEQQQKAKTNKTAKTESRPSPKPEKVKDGNMCHAHAISSCMPMKLSKDKPKNQDYKQEEIQQKVAVETVNTAINSFKSQTVLPKVAYKTNETTEIKVEKTFIPPDIIQVKEHFTKMQYSDDEATKFYHYYQTIGWKLAGKHTISDWHSLAVGWMSKVQQFKPPENQTIAKAYQHPPNSPLRFDRPNKNYHIPL